MYEWPDTEQGVIDLLNGRPEPRPRAAGSTPSPRPDEYLRIMTIDGYDVDDAGRMQSTVLAIEGWARTPGRARRIVLDARRALHQAAEESAEVDGQPIRRVVEKTHPIRRSTGEDGRHMTAMNVAIHQRH